jgi:outer membrane protein assembly factor BamB
MVYFGSFDDAVYAVNASTGHLVWTFATGDYANSSPSVVDDVVYVGSSDGHVYAFDSATGMLAWKFNCNYDVSASPAVVDGVVYVPSYDGNVFALDALSGDLIWNHTTTTLGGFDASPSIGYDLVYISTKNGLYALNVENGAEVWFFDGGLIQASPAVAGELVYVGGKDNMLYVLDAHTGVKVWEFSAGSYIRGEAVVVDGVVYVGTLDGTVYAIGSRYYVIDFNYDDKVDNQDFYLFLQAYTNYQHGKTYDPKYDLDDDGDIDLVDMDTFAVYLNYYYTG